MATARVATAKRGDITRMLSLAGQFQAYQVVDVHPKVGGYMRLIRVDVGDRVRQGQELAVLEVPELNAELQQTVYQVDQARDELSRADHDLSRAQAQHQAVHEQYTRLKSVADAHPGLIAQQELDNARAADMASEAQVDASRAALSAARQRAGSVQSDNQRVRALHNYTHVVAPIAGVVAWRYADTGALIQSGTNSNNQDLPIVRLAQSNILRLRVPVPEADVRYVHEGDTVEVRIDALGRTIMGKITRFTRDISTDTRTMQTEVDINNQDLSIDPGMYANAHLALDHVEHVVTIPVEAIVLHNKQNYVYVVGSDNRIHLRPVQIGVQGNKLAEIRSGLAESERVLIGGQEQYADNQLVRPIPTDSAASEAAQLSGGAIDLHSEGGSH